MSNNNLSVEFFDENNSYTDDRRRAALIEINPQGFTIRHPPKPYELNTDITDDTQLFQTIHMGAAVVDAERWRLVVDGMVEHPFQVSLAQLRDMPAHAVTAFHECYGSPIKPPTTALWRIGNVQWRGVRLSTLLGIARPSAEAQFVWSEGMEHGTFASITADCYQKDLPIEKAMRPEVLLAYELNDQPLTKERGFPVRLVVPGWFGTNSTKWICRLSVRDCRAPGPYTTRLYNEIDPSDPAGKRIRPVWSAEVNSVICHPQPDEKVLVGGKILIWGRAWGSEEVDSVDLSVDSGHTWFRTDLESRREFEWQRFEKRVDLSVRGAYHIMSRARDKTGAHQPLTGRRNHVHSINIEVI